MLCSSCGNNNNKKYCRIGIKIDVKERCSFFSKDKPKVSNNRRNFNYENNPVIKELRANMCKL